MPNAALKDHYERKYSHESSAQSIDLIRQTSAPTSRFEAVVKYFPHYYKTHM